MQGIQYFYHYSEDPHIELFEPRPGRQVEGRPPGEQLVWAIDEHYSPVYYFPRQCPRLVLWREDGSTQEDVDRWMGSEARMVAHIETAWADRFESCQLCRYSFDSAGFESLHDHGVHVTPEAVRPIDVTSVGRLADALANENVELRTVDSFQPLADARHSTLHFSGIRLKNAQKRLVLVGENPR